MKPFIPIMLGLAVLVTTGAYIPKWDYHHAAPSFTHITGAGDHPSETKPEPAKNEQQPETGSNQPSASLPETEKHNPALPAEGNTSTGVNPDTDPVADQPASVTRIAYLTFDDGPDPGSTIQIMNILD
jgi:peptidoglycan/xylan/chitin deacetylase (PgdA/CDA1 family)